MNFRGTRADFQYLKKISGQDLELEERSINPNMPPCDVGTSLEVTIDDDFAGLSDGYMITDLLQSMIHDRTHVCVNEAWLHIEADTLDTDDIATDEAMDTVLIEKIIPFVYDEPNVGLFYDVEGSVYVTKYDRLLPAAYDQEFLTFTL